MGLLKDSDKKQLKQAFDEHMDKPVKILMFTQQMECEFCSSTRELIEEVVALSDNLKMETYDFVEDKPMVEKYNIDKIPAVAILGEGGIDYGIRFYGIPAGYEFTSLVEDIVDVSRGTANLPQAVLDELAKVDKPVHLQVMVSPSCPYCPKAVRAAHRFAIANPNIRSDMVEVTEFPHLVQKYDVQGVPNTIINEAHKFVGAVPELEAIQEMLNAIEIKTVGSA